MNFKKFSAALATAAAALPLSAMAHVGADGGGHHGLLSSFGHAFAHPFTGADHMAAMLAVGAWSALTVTPAWRAPAAFVALLVAGALAGFAGLWVPGVEPMIAASVLVLGGVFAFFHGAAHGFELAADSALASAGALAGMALGSALLHVGGMVLGKVFMQRHRWLAKLAGGATAVLGAAMLTRLA